MVSRPITRAAPDLADYGHIIGGLVGGSPSADLPLSSCFRRAWDRRRRRTLVATVIAVIQRGERRWVHLDAGVFTGLVETLEEAIRYRLETDRVGPVVPTVLAGPTCDSADVLYEADSGRPPDGLAEGDEVRFLSAGAYTSCYSTVQRFRPLPTVLV